VVHVTLALLVPRSLLAMVTGGPLLDKSLNEAPSAAPAVAKIETTPEIKPVPEIKIVPEIEPSP
jgi:hypothetical protein